MRPCSSVSVLRVLAFCTSGRWMCRTVQVVATWSDLTTSAPPVLISVSESNRRLEGCGRLVRQKRASACQITETRGQGHAYETLHVSTHIGLITLRGRKYRIQLAPHIHIRTKSGTENPTRRFLRGGCMGFCHVAARSQTHHSCMDECHTTEVTTLLYIEHTVSVFIRVARLDCECTALCSASSTLFVSLPACSNHALANVHS